MENMRANYLFFPPVTFCLLMCLAAGQQCGWLSCLPVCAYNNQHKC